MAVPFELDIEALERRILEQLHQISGRHRRCGNHGSGLAGLLCNNLLDVVSDRDALGPGLGEDALPDFRRKVQVMVMAGSSL
jgi:hypothetical protein